MFYFKNNLDLYWQRRRKYEKTEEGKRLKSLRDKRYRENHREDLKLRRKKYDEKYESSDKYKKSLERYKLSDSYKKRIEIIKESIRNMNPEEYALYRQRRNEICKKYYLSDKGKESSRRSGRLRDLRERAAGNLDNQDYLNLLKNSEGKCYYCGKELNGEYHIDHKIPVSKGGTNAIENLAVSCPECNRKKQAMTDIEFINKMNFIILPERCFTIPVKGERE
jgi:5-methylcytosine-specific restriction endonuclease McrA